MSDTLESLISETTQLTGAAPPSLLDEASPTLVHRDTSIYLIGLIGGKDVGKSTLINALAGEAISTPSSFGPGTEKAIAYVHRDSATTLQTLLADIPSKQLELRSHNLEHLRRQVLVDLPDIDSKYADHAELTRKMLRHILFPLWLQSVEKYADQRPAQLLAAVAQGNDASNFTFCLSKADQVAEPAAREIATDYAQRLMKRLSLASPPRVLLISSTQPEQFDLGQLREMLQTQRSEKSVQQSTALAVQRKDLTLRSWLADQQLDQRSATAERTLRAAEDLVADRIAAPLLESTVPAMAADPAQRLWLTEPALDARMSRWPIVSVLHGVASPLIALVRSNLASRGTRGASIDQLFAQASGRPLESLVQSVFAHLRQINPGIDEALRNRPIWESAVAAEVTADLQQRFAAVLQRQREAAVRSVSGPLTVLLAPLRWLLTLGVLIWFPIVQPILARYLNEGLIPNWHDIAKVLVPLLGATYLLQCGAFLLIWFVALWCVLIWNTQRRVGRLIRGWSTIDALPQLSLSAATMDWTKDLLRPLSERHAQADSLSRRVAALLR